MTSKPFPQNEQQASVCFIIISIIKSETCIDNRVPSAKPYGPYVSCEILRLNDHTISVNNKTLTGSCGIKPALVITVRVECERRLKNVVVAYFKALSLRNLMVSADGVTKFVIYSKFRIYPSS
jgi:hypothetical protein